MVFAGRKIFAECGIKVCCGASKVAYCSLKVWHFRNLFYFFNHRLMAAAHYQRTLVAGYCTKGTVCITSPHYSHRMAYHSVSRHISGRGMWRTGKREGINLIKLICFKRTYELILQNPHSLLALKNRNL